jgi:hypothetical protein
MGFIKTVFKKLLIAAVTGAIILAFVYYKDSYLEKGNSDMQLLNSVTLEKQNTQVPTSTPKEEESLKIEVVMPNTNSNTLLAEDSSYAIEEKVKVVQKAPSQAQSFEEYKRSMGFKSQEEAFKELEQQTNR